MAKAKGTTVIGVVKYLRREKEAARKALPARLHHYLEERCSPSAWYPEEDWVELVRAQAKLVKEPKGNVFETIGRWALREHADGLYGHLLSDISDPLSLSRRLLALWGSQHDTGRLSFTMDGETAARVELVDYGHTSTVMCQILRGYLSELLTLAGFPSPSVEKRECRLAGAAQCAWRCSWEKA
jgi:hypothetical protein